jgi:hypothetical protein
MMALAKPASTLAPLHQFTLKMETGQEEMWLALRAMPKTGFTAQMLADASEASRSKAEFYLAQLTRKDLAREIGMSHTREKMFTVPRLIVDPEVFDKQGKPDRDYLIRKVLWTALRHQKIVSVSSLHTFAREHISIERPKVEQFLKRLAAAHYVHERVTDKEPIFQLRPSMNFGKLPPRFCQATLVFDVNARAFFGEAVATQVAL